jgi:hypothetical protein
VARARTHDSAAVRLGGSFAGCEGQQVTEGLLDQVAQLLAQRNRIDEQIAAIMRRPMTAGHLGEWLAAQIFDIELETSAVAVAIDGRFRSGPLAGRTVNIKWYLKREGLLDVVQAPVLDYYLVLTGPTAAAAPSRGKTRPWCISAVYSVKSDRRRRWPIERIRHHPSVGS